ncbi:putative protein kinase RLK-Pelle-L-LEC family [Helianthus annuus]|nr:putative protein kinase RLK-Pelle-L-LEC family [Helianthus annuus]
MYLYIYTLFVTGWTTNSFYEHNIVSLFKTLNSEIQHKAGKVSDVYSFGVVALEIATGKKPLDPMAEDGQIRLVDHVWDFYGRGKLSEVADPKLDADFDEGEMERVISVGLWCAHTDPNARPSIKQAIQVLNFEAPFPSLSKTVPSAIFATPVNMSAFWSSPSIDLTGSGTGSSSASSTTETQ